MEPIRLTLLPDLCVFSQKHLLKNLPEDKLGQLDEILDCVESLESSFTLRLMCTAKYRLYLAIFIMSVVFAFTGIVPILGLASVFTLICCPHVFYGWLVRRAEQRCTVAIRDLNSICKPSLVTSYEISSPDDSVRLGSERCLATPNISVSVLFKRNSQWSPLTKSAPATGVSSSKKRIITASKRRIETAMLNQGPLGSERSLNRSKSRMDSPSEAGKISVGGQPTPPADPDMVRRVKLFGPIVQKLTLLSKVYAPNEEKVDAIIPTSQAIVLQPAIFQGIQPLDLKINNSSLQRLNKNNLPDADDWPVTESDERLLKPILVSPPISDIDSAQQVLLSKRKESMGRELTSTPKFGKNHEYTKLRLFAVVAS